MRASSRHKPATTMDLPASLQVPATSRARSRCCGEQTQNRTIATSKVRFCVCSR
ncbi:hypothetical protein I553_7434 [Mycobacterium xenopi 4042]|uniref:Uncharacterized protein n=1 Tax=Mycobacterium xenopi 4042 TaxID=1299334 RepID=X8E6T0_MYCXE|nr:hypothetical protein I553_7434 [Mycobacterium xenopi 4042]